MLRASALSKVRGPAIAGRAEGGDHCVIRIPESITKIYLVIPMSEPETHCDEVSMLRGQAARILWQNAQKCEPRFMNDSRMIGRPHLGQLLPCCP